MTTVRNSAGGRDRAGQASGGRDPWFDNSKMLLVTLVVLGHTWSKLEVLGDGIPPDENIAHVYDFVYAWHVPAFVLVTGYLSRSMTWSRHRLRSLVTTVAVPYVVFECALTAVHRYVGGLPTNDLLRIPHSPMWFLAAMFLWRLVTPAFLRLPRSVALATAVVLSLLSGLTTMETLAFDRFLGFLPFFVLGLVLRREDWEALRRPVVKVVAVVVLVLLWRQSANTDEHITSAWFHYAAPYRELDVSNTEGMVTRLVLIGIALAAALAFFALVPRGRSWLTTLGAATMTVYVFHDFFVLAMAYSDYPVYARPDRLEALWVSSAGAVVVAVVLALPVVARTLDPVVDPFGFLSRRRERRSSAPRSD